MKRILTLCLLLAATTFSLFAQPDKKDVRQGNRMFRKGKYAEADISYRKGLLKDSTSVAANYDLASNLYRQENYDEALKCLDRIKESAPETRYGADYFYNLGDVALKKEDYRSAVLAFGQSLLLRPDDMDAKENYIYAKMKMKDQEGQGGGNQDQNQDQKQDQNQNQNQDQNQDQHQNQDQNKDQGQQPYRGEISPQQAQQMLQAIQAQEKETQDKVNKEKAAALKARQKDKNW